MLTENSKSYNTTITLFRSIARERKVTCIVIQGVRTTLNKRRYLKIYKTWMPLPTAKVA